MLRVVLGHPRLLPFDDFTGAVVVLVRPKGFDLAPHEVVADASHQRVPVGRRVKVGVPHVGARLDFLVDVMQSSRKSEWGGGSGTPGDSRRPAPARGQPGVGTHRDS